MRRALSSLILLPLLALTLTPPALAQPTAPGTVLNFNATMDYQVAGAAGNLVTASSAVVSELLDVVVVWQDTEPVPGTPGELNVVTTFLLTNLGNGSEAFALRVDVTPSGDQFDPVLAELWLDNGDGRFDRATDTRYQPGSNEPLLAAGDETLVFVLCNMPLLNTLRDGHQGVIDLTARAVTNSGGAGPGAVIAGLGDGGVDAVVGNSSATTQASGIYQIAGFTLQMAKDALIVSDPQGNDPPMPYTGSVLRYLLTLTVQGPGVAKNVVVRDPVPAATRYKPGSLVVNGVAQSDTEDGDAGHIAEGRVVVKLGDLTKEANPVITFEVTID